MRKYPVSVFHLISGVDSRMLKGVSLRKLVKKFRTLGFDGPYSGGRHLFMTRGTLKVHIPNPHAGDISKHLLREILKQADISVKKWNDID